MCSWGGAHGGAIAIATQAAVPQIDRLFQEISEHIQLHDLRPVIHARQRRMTYGGHYRS